MRRVPPAAKKGANASAQQTAESAAVGSSADAGAAEVAALQQQLREREDREVKLKQLTVKAKKEATEWKNKVIFSLILVLIANIWLT